MNLYRIFFCSLFIPKSPMRTRASLGKKMPARAKGKAQGKAKAKAQPAAKRQRTCAPEGTIGLAHAGMGSLQRHRIMKPEVDEDLKFKNDLQQFKNDLKEFQLELYEVEANPPPVDEELKQLWKDLKQFKQDLDQFKKDLMANGTLKRLEKLKAEETMEHLGRQRHRFLNRKVFGVGGNNAKGKGKGKAQRPADDSEDTQPVKMVVVDGVEEWEWIPGGRGGPQNPVVPMQARPIPVPTGAWKHLEVPGGFIHKG